MKLNGFVNLGFCQGILIRPITIIGDNAIKADIKVLDSRVDPQLKKRKSFMFSFVAREEIAKDMLRKCDVGDLILISYRLDTHFWFNKNTGIGRIQYQMDVEDFCVKQIIPRSRINYLNRGLYQCTFLDIQPQLKSEGIYVLNTLTTVPNTSEKRNMSFIVFGSFGESIAKRYIAGQEITIEYKLEISKGNLSDGTTEVFVNCVVERIL